MFSRNTNDDLSKSSLWHPPDLCGVLEKQGRWRGAWRARYFILKGSNLFWFTNPTAKKPQGHVPLEGASVHAIKPPAISVYTHHMKEQERNGMPLLYGIILSLDEAYASSPGGRSELVLAAASAELQALWCKALQQASIPRPQLLAKLHQSCNKLSEVLGDFGPVRSAPASSTSSHPSRVSGGRRHSILSGSDPHSSQYLNTSAPSQPLQQQQHLSRTVSIPSSQGIRFASPQPRPSLAASDPRRPVSDTGAGPRQSFAFDQDMPTTSPSSPRHQEVLPSLAAYTPGMPVAHPGNMPASIHGSYRKLSIPHTSASLPMSEQEMIARQLGPPFVVPPPDSAYGGSNSSGRRPRGKSPFRARAEKLLGGLKNLFNSGSEDSRRWHHDDVPYYPYEAPEPAYGPTPSHHMVARRAAMSEATSWAAPPINPIVTYGSTLDTGSQSGSPGGAMRPLSPSASIGAVGGSFVHGIINDWAASSLEAAGRQGQASHRTSPLGSAASQPRSSISPAYLPASRKTSLLPLEPLDQPRNAPTTRNQLSFSLNGTSRAASFARTEPKSSILAGAGLEGLLSRSASTRAASLLSPTSSAPADPLASGANANDGLLATVAAAQQQVARASELLAHHASQLSSTSTAACSSPASSQATHLTSKTTSVSEPAAVLSPAAASTSSTAETKAEQFVATISQLQTSLDRVKASLSHPTSSTTPTAAAPGPELITASQQDFQPGYDLRHSAALQALAASKAQLESCLTILQDTHHMGPRDSHALAAVTVSVQRALADMYIHIHGAECDGDTTGAQWEFEQDSDVYAVPDSSAARASVSFSGFSPSDTGNNVPVPHTGSQRDGQMLPSNRPSMSAPATPRKSDIALIIGPGGAVGVSDVEQSGVLLGAQQCMDHLVNPQLAATYFMGSSDGPWSPQHATSGFMSASNQAFSGHQEGSIPIPGLGLGPGGLSEARESITLSMHDVNARLVALSSSLKERSERASIDSSELDSPAHSARRVMASTDVQTQDPRLAGHLGQVTGSYHQSDQGLASMLSSADHTRASMHFNPEQLGRQSMLTSQGQDGRASMLSSADHTRASMQFNPEQLSRQSMLTSQGQDGRASMLSSADHTRASMQFNPEQLGRQSHFTDTWQPEPVASERQNSYLAPEVPGLQRSVSINIQQAARSSILSSTPFDAACAPQVQEGCWAQEDAHTCDNSWRAAGIFFAGNFARQESVRTEQPPASRSSFNFSVVSRQSEYEGGVQSRTPSTAAIPRESAAVGHSNASFGDQDAMARQSIAARASPSHSAYSDEPASRLNQAGRLSGSDNARDERLNEEPSVSVGAGHLKVPSALVPISEVMHESGQLGGRTSERADWLQNGGVVGQVQVASTQAGFTATHSSHLQQFGNLKEFSYSVGTGQQGALQSHYDDGLDAAPRRARYSSTDYC